MMKVAVSGANGLVGSRLLSTLQESGHEVVKILRNSASARPQDIVWNQKADSEALNQLEKVDAVIHLSGESIASGRWNDAKKKAIRNSRVEPTRALSEKLAEFKNGPKTFLCASAIGFYGDRGAQELNETSPAGTDFLSDVCKEWESATTKASEAGIRVVNLRTGVVLSKEGGALKAMLPPFLMGAGGNMGDGVQYMSWIDIDDEAKAIYHCLITESLSGPVNLVAPDPVSNAQFTKALGAAIKRPTIFPMPAFAARLLLGEMADALILSSTRVKCDKLEKSGFQFGYPKINDSLNHVLNGQTSTNKPTAGY
jgi:uncharacterized protein (TIGR01777 family)